jgi:hypothetical protein
VGITHYPCCIPTRAKEFELDKPSPDFNMQPGRSQRPLNCINNPNPKNKYDAGADIFE